MDGDGFQGLQGFAGPGTGTSSVYKGVRVKGLTDICGQVRPLGQRIHKDSFFYDTLFLFDLEVFWKHGQRKTVVAE